MGKNQANQVFKPVIQSLLDTDLYKYTMLQVMVHQSPSAKAKSEFLCRKKTDRPMGDLLEQVNQQIDHLCTLQLTEEELDYLAKRQFFKPDFIEFLRLFRLQRKFIEVTRDGDHLRIVAQGPLVHITLFEVFVLSIVNELYFRAEDARQCELIGVQRLNAKIEQFKAVEAEALAYGKPFEFLDFGTRRRYSREWHERVVATLAKELPNSFRGTSNMDLARRYGLVVHGTMAHEHFQKHQAMGVQLVNSQKAALEEWVQEYRGDLGIALTDVIGIKPFLRDFDRFYALLFNGVRHDSGDPVEWGEAVIRHYISLKINPASKRLVFSDGLDVKTSIDLWRHFRSRIETGFGIGTNLTCDVGPKALSIVMKLTRVNDQPVAKISDSPGKTMCDDKVFLRYLCQVFEVDSSFLDN